MKKQLIETTSPTKALTSLAIAGSLFMSWNFIALPTAEAAIQTRSETNISFVANHPETSMFYDWASQYPELVTMLSQEDITIFAPTNKAMLELPIQTLENLRDSQPLRRQLIDYHTLDGRVYSGALYNQTKLYTTQEDFINVDTRYGWDIKLNDYALVKTDIFTRNGVIHFVDGVLLPKQIRFTPTISNTTIENYNYNQSMYNQSLYNQTTEYIPTKLIPASYNQKRVEVPDNAPSLNNSFYQKNISQTLEEDARFSTLNRLIKNIGLDSLFMNRQYQYTLFAPTNEAFDRLGNDKLMKIQSNPLLGIEVLLNHVAMGRVGGNALELQYDGAVSIDQNLYPFGQNLNSWVEARVVLPNLEATNGWIHGIDRVIENE